MTHRQDPDAIDHDRDHVFARTLARDRVAHGRIYPLKHDVAAFADTLLGILFPQLSDDALAAPDDLAARLVLARRDLHRLVEPLTSHDKADAVIAVFAEELPAVHTALLLDGEAILAGDPAAESLDEVVAAYPGFLAIAIHRIAHVLYGLDVPILPRLLAEVAHTRTGIDIHPGATIGRGFCIDHGTGIVVGETAVIGDGVKLYQGVTLGALSVVKNLAGHKRHPTIGDGVVIYANATVLGGETVVGTDSIIGGNVFVTSSVPAGSVLYQTSRAKVRQADDWFSNIDFVI